ncbi:TM2 domain-containing protein-like protein [Euroglyphus maynei]|uniref:TM2 domain-containing protein-like protein n=1 Tax=Euroglyphus maynei TaxID=6958 RepID=A0A1Y3BH90_EURMA|nr:TM2 domain-containing protein-like protein [Euroglyphus maynei]
MNEEDYSSNIIMNGTNNDNNHHQMPSFQIDCYSLKIGQFRCDPIEIDEDTQQPIGCSVNNLAPINCTLINGLICDEQSKNLSIISKTTNDNNQRIQLAIPCQYTNGYSYEITLILSIFLGMFGIDRFYLGYPAIGLLKFCTLGFLFLGQFIDIILIAMQIVRPADGSNYIIKFFGPKLTIINSFRRQRFGLFDNIPFIYDDDYYNDNNNYTDYRMVIQSGFDLYFYPPTTINNIVSNHFIGNNETLIGTSTAAAHHTNL